jgi:energy-converting hydrogenase Eha subunit A
MAEYRSRSVEWSTIAAVVAAGILVALVTGFTISQIEMRTGSNPLTASGSSPVPVSAVGVGFVSLALFTVTANVLGVDTSRRVQLLTGMLIGAAALIFSHRFCYQSMVVDGRPMSTSLHFGTYLKSVITNCTVPNGPQLNGMEFGPLGWFRATAQVLAFAIGGWAIAPMWASVDERKRSTSSTPDSQLSFLHRRPLRVVTGPVPGAHADRTV